MEDNYYLIISPSNESLWKKPTCIIHKYVVQNNCPIVQLGPPPPNSRQYTLIYFDFY